MTFDEARGEIVLFGPLYSAAAFTSSGGLPQPGAASSETWTWRGGRWARLAPTSSPPPRTSAGMAYDKARQQVVLFGGQDAVEHAAGQGLPPLQDTWTWDGSNWSKAKPIVNPPAAVGALLAYDKAINRTVMLLDAVHGNTQETETWTWDGNNWIQLHPAASPPAPRFGASMTYDASTATIVVFGQIVYIMGPQAGQTDTTTWTFDGMNWSPHSGGGHPGGLEFAAMAYDGASGTVLHFGGGAGLTFFDDTWSWHGAGWSRLNPAAGPWERSEPLMAYDGADREMILYGGVVHSQNSAANFYDTWSWDGTNWKLRQSTVSTPSAKELDAMVGAGTLQAASQLKLRYLPGGCAKGQGCLATSQPAFGAVGVDAGYFELVARPQGGADSHCMVYVARDSEASPWHFVDVACGPGAYPQVNARDDSVKASGCAKVRDAPEFGKVVACLPNGMSVWIDDGPFYVANRLWWHLQGRGWMAHELLIKG